MSVAVEEEIDLDEDNIDDMYLVFRIAKEKYAVEIACVTEIIGLQKIIEVPDVPSYVRGVINLRGQVIPVMDVRLRFNLPFESYTDRTVIIVLEIDDVQTGLVVDGVNDVIEVKPEQIDPPPQWQGADQSDIGTDSTGVIKGLVRQGDQVNILLDIEKLLYSDDINIQTADIASASNVGAMASSAVEPGTDSGSKTDQEDSDTESKTEQD